jgi:hypothetical protein
MKYGSLVHATLAGLAVASLAGPAAAGRGSRTAPSTWALVSDGSVKINTYYFGAGFEASEGFSLGPFDGQKSWTVSGIDLPFAAISNANPFTGSQHLRMSSDTTTGTGVLRIALSPEQTTAPNTPCTIYIKVNISNDGGADYDLVGQAPSQGVIAWRVKFSWSDDSLTGPGMIYVLDTISGSLVYANTGITWTPGVYKELRVDFDPLGSAIRYFYDGSLIYTGHMVSATTVEQIAILHDNWQKTGETADFDALSVQTLGEPPVAVRQMTWGQVKNLLR